MQYLLYPIIKKELTSYFAAPALYLIAAAFLAVAGYLFYGNLVMLLLFQGSAVSVSLWEYSLNDLRLLVMVLAPYVTMRSFAEEKKQGTLELLYTAPVSDRAILTGKYIAAFATVVLIVSCTLAYPLLYGAFYPIDWGPVLGGYAGLFLLTMAIVSLGIFISALTEHQIIAAGAAMGLSFLLWFIGGAAEADGPLSDVPAAVSLQRHFYGFSRGVIATRDVLFFALLSALSLAITHAWLRQRGAEQRVLRIGWLPGFKIPGALFCGTALIAVVIFMAGMSAAARWNKRIDVTPDKAFTLSSASAGALENLSENFSLTVACGSEDRYQYEDFLELFRQSSRHFTYRLMRIDKNPVAADNALLHQQGAAIAQYRGKTATIRKVHELSIVQAIHELTRGETKTIRIYAGGTGRANQAMYSAADQDLRQRGYSLVFSEIEALRDIPQDTRLVIVRDVQHDIPAHGLNAVRKYFDAGGRVLLLLPGDRPVPATGAFLKQHNVELGSDLIIDSGNPSFDFDPLTQVIYPSKAHPAFEKIAAPAVFRRVRSVQVGTEFAPGYTWTILCQSGRGSWAESDPDSIAKKTAAFDSGRDIYGPVAAGVTVEKKQAGGDSPEGKGRLAVIGNSSFTEEEYYPMLGNADLYAKTVEWLAVSTTLPVELQQPPRGKPRTNITMSSFQGALFFWLLVVAEPLLVLLAGIGVAATRRIRN